MRPFSQRWEQEFLKLQIIISMLKQQTLSLLSGNSFSNYLKGMELLEENLRNSALAESDLDQEIMERACGVLILEKWAEYPDYFSGLDRMMEELPRHRALLSDSEVGHYLAGMSIFINGLNEGKHDVSGFIYASHGGWLLSMTAAEQIAEYLTGKEDYDTALVFSDIAGFFKQINSAQFGIIHDLMGIESWNQGMADGFYNILIKAGISDQSWMLGSLYKVIKDPIVKKSIFSRYKSVLKKAREKYEGEDNPAAVAEIDLFLEMVVIRSKGKIPR